MKSFFAVLLTVFSCFNAYSINNTDSLKIKTVGKSSIEASFTSKKQSSAKITISNQSGKVVFTQNFKVVIGSNKIALIDTKTIDEGTYTVSLIYAGKKMKTKFINFKGEI
jgi:anti-sigma28 factor (negative regulator of flagellin synthesis)